jgi:hypothetical protein
MSISTPINSGRMTRIQDGHQRRMQRQILEATEAPSDLASPDVGLICAIIPPGTMQPKERGIRGTSMRVYMAPRYPATLGVSPHVVARELSYDFPVGTTLGIRRGDGRWYRFTLHGPGVATVRGIPATLTES